MSRTCDLSMKKLLIFDMHDLNGALFLKIRFSFFSFASFLLATVIHLFTTTYASLQPRRFDLNDGELNLFFWLTEH